MASPWVEPQSGALGARERSAGPAAAESGKTSSAAGSVPAGSAGTRRAGPVALTMVSCWDTGVLLCALLGGLLLTG